MKYLKYFESKYSIDSICYKYGIRNYTINSNGTVDVNGDVDLVHMGLRKLPVKFGYVSGNFYCSRIELTTLEGAPREVGGYFSCNDNQLTSLLGAPKKVGGDFDCSDNQLTSLVGAPEEVGGSFYCNNNQLTSLKGAPIEVGGDFDCDFNKLTTLIGAPEDVGGDFYCVENPALPQEIWDNREYINKIVKYQSDYNIWRRDGTLDAYRFSDMMKEIMEEVK